MKSEMQEIRVESAAKCRLTFPKFDSSSTNRLMKIEVEKEINFSDVEENYRCFQNSALFNERYISIVQNISEKIPSRLLKLESVVIQLFLFVGDIFYIF